MQYATACAPPEASMPARSEPQPSLMICFGLPQAATGTGVGAGVGLTTGVGVGEGVAAGTGDGLPESADGAADGPPAGAGDGLAVVPHADRAIATRRSAAANPLRPGREAIEAFIGSDPRRRSSVLDRSACAEGRARDGGPRRTLGRA